MPPLHRALFAAAALAAAAATLLAPLADRSIVARAALPGVSGAAPPWAEGPFACDAIVRRRCGGGAGAARLCDARTEAAVMAQSPAGAAGAIADEDGFARSFRFYACAAAAAAAAAPTRARGEDASAVGPRFGYAPPPAAGAPPLPARARRSVDAEFAQFGQPRARFAASAGEAGAIELEEEEQQLFGASARRFSRRQRVGNGATDAERFGSSPSDGTSAADWERFGEGAAGPLRAADRFGLSAEARMRLAASPAAAAGGRLGAGDDERFGAPGAPGAPACDSDARGPVACLETSGIARIGTQGVRCSCWVRGDVDLGEDSALLRQFPLLQENPTAPREFEGEPSASVSQSASASATPSASASRSASAWPSLTMSATPSPSPTVSTTSTSSLTASTSRSASSTPSTTPSISNTPTSTPSSSRTPSTTSTLTATPSKTASVTPTTTPGKHLSASGTVSISPSPTPSRSITASPTTTPTPPTPSRTSSVTRTRSPTRTPASIRVTFQPLSNTKPVGTQQLFDGGPVPPSASALRTPTHSRAAVAPSASTSKSETRTPTPTYKLSGPQSTVVRLN